MRSAILYVFSGTGNTLIAADMIAEALGVRGIQASVCRVKKPFSGLPDPNDYDICGFGYPVHAFNTPQLFQHFAKTLPTVLDKPAFVFKTSGEPFSLNNASSRALVRILRKKGFRPGLDRHLLMPYNIMFRYPDALAKQMYVHTRGMANVIADAVSKEAWRTLTYHPLAVLTTGLLRLQWFGAWINGPLIYASKKACVGCGVCAANCPAANIRMKNGRPRFSRHCSMCMSCAFRCPKDAVRPGILNLWRVNGAYPFAALEKDDSVPDRYVNAETQGYFKLFLPYYEQSYAEIETAACAREEKGAKESEVAQESMEQ